MSVKVKDVSVSHLIYLIMITNLICLCNEILALCKKSTPEPGDRCT